MQKNNVLWKKSIRILSLILVLSISSCPMSFGDIASMSSREMIEYTTRGVRNARITVGIIQNGQMSFTVYGENGKVRPAIEHIYEIGSITKVFTAQLFAKAMSEGRVCNVCHDVVSLDCSIDHFLELSTKAYYPTIRRLLTHTSGYARSYYYGNLLPPQSVPFGSALNGITRKMVLDRIGTINLENRDYQYSYSNVGIALVGLVLEEIYNKEFSSLMNEYLKNELGLNNTKVNDGSGDLSHYWILENGNPYIATGFLTSSITDMLKFALMQINIIPSYVGYTQNTLAEIIPRLTLPGFDFGFDSIGLGWHIDSLNSLIFHGGDTGNQHSCIIIDKTDNTAIVVLSNMSGNFRINGQLIGFALLRELRG